MCLNTGTDENVGVVCLLKEIILGAVGENSTFTGHSSVSIGQRDRDHVLADWDEGPRVQPANPTDGVSFRGGREGEEPEVLGRARREKNPKSWVGGHTMLLRGL